MPTITVLALVVGGFLLGALFGYKVAGRRTSPRCQHEATNTPAAITTPLALTPSVMAATRRAPPTRTSAAKSTPLQDDLKRIKGVGQLNESRLHSFGVTRLAQIAAWSTSDVTRIGNALALGGRIEREQWVEQARALVGEAAQAAPCNTD